MVVTMFSISELSLASSSGMVLISIAWLGISSAACFSSARAARASMQAFSTTRLSSSRAGGSAGSRLCGSSGRQGDSRPVMMQKCHFVDTSAAYVAADDTSV